MSRDAHSPPLPRGGPLGVTSKAGHVRQLAPNNDCKIRATEPHCARVLGGGRDGSNSRISLVALLQPGRLMPNSVQELRICSHRSSRPAYPVVQCRNRLLAQAHAPCVLAPA